MLSTPSKRLKVDLISLKSISFVNCHEVLYNNDLLGKIISYLKIVEILKKIIFLHKNTSNYLTINSKSIPIIKQSIKFDFGELVNKKSFEDAKKQKLHLNTSIDYIKLFYLNLFYLYKNNYFLAQT